MPALIRLVTVIGLLGIILTACGKDKPDTPPPTGETVTLSPIVRAHLQEDYETLLAAQQAIAAIWDGLATGKQVQCGDYPRVPNPEDISTEGDSAFDPVVETLRRAAIETGKAVNLWRAECQKSRTNPSPDVIDQGRLASRAAGDALREAESMFSP